MKKRNFAFRNTAKYLCFLLCLFVTSTLWAQVQFLEESTITTNGLYFHYASGAKSYHYNPNISPRGDCVTVVNDYVFFGWYRGGMSDRKLMISRKKIGSDNWVSVELPHKNTFIENTNWGDSHRTISVGVSKIDGTVHIFYDHHNDPLKYIISKKNVAFGPDEEFTASNFETTRGWLAQGENIQITYPKITQNEAGNIIVNYRVGSAVGGDEKVHVYNGDTWTQSKLVTKGRLGNVALNNYAYGSPYYNNGDVYYAFSVRWASKYDDGVLNEGVYLAKCGPTFTDKWEDLNGNLHSLPIDDFSPFLIDLPASYGSKGSSGGPGLVVSEDGDIHITYDGRGTDTTYEYTYVRKAGETSFTKNPGVRKTGLSWNSRFYTINASTSGNITITSGEPGSLSYTTELVHSTSRNFGNSASYIADGKLVLIVAENKQADKKEIYSYVFQLPGGSAGPTTPTSGLVAHWPLNEGAGTVASDAAGFGFDGELLNGASWGSDAERDSYVSFDGIDDRIATTFKYAIADTNDFTWAWWANKQTPAGTDSGSIMVGNRYGNTGTEAFEFIKFTPVNVQIANTSDSTKIEQFDYADIPQNEWHHYAMVKTGTSYQWHVDGVAQGAPQTFSYNETSPLPFFIGGDTDDKPNEHFQGFIDDVVLYRSALTPEEIVNVQNEIYRPIITMVGTGPAESTAGATWSDGLPAHSGADYIVSGNLKGEGGSSTFPGLSLSVKAGGKFQVRSLESSGEVMTVNNLILQGGSSFNEGSFAQLAAGTGNDEFNVLNGTITSSGSTRFITYGSAINRGLKVLSKINGDGTLQASGGAGVVIENAANTFSGTWTVGSATTLTFSNGGAVGSADINVLDSGKLKVTADWYSSATLSVTDSATTQVDFEAYDWVVSSLVFGGSVLAEGRYSAATLNALGANAVFSGSGTIYVGIPPTYELIAGWEQWAVGTSPATIQSNGLTATAAIGDFGISKWGACSDGTFGNLVAPRASSITAEHTDGLRKTGATELSIDFTIENTSGDPLELETLYFDAMLKTADTGPKQWNLQVVSGGLTTGSVVTKNLAYNKTGSDLTDYSVDLTQLTDYTLNGGESAVLRLTFTGGNASNTSNVDMDNVALTGAFITGTTPVAPPTMEVEQINGAFDFSWTGNGFKVQSRTNLTEGVWIDVPGGNTPPVHVIPTDEAAFYRLIGQ